MMSTSLTVCGLHQTSVARTLIELPGNADKGLKVSAFLAFSKASYCHFDSLEHHKLYCEKTLLVQVENFAAMWGRIEH